jgi:inosine/xanthosine triphosphate pyrophosphatase family protein
MVGLSTLVVDALDGEPGIGAENVNVASGIDMGMYENGVSGGVGM